MFLSFTVTTADNLHLQSNLAQGGTGFSGANGGVAYGGGIYTQRNYLVMISDLWVTLNTAQGGFGGTSAGGFGGGIAHFDDPGVLQLGTNINVWGNHASTFGDDSYPF
jgi:hypothetical protein